MCFKIHSNCPVWKTSSLSADPRLQETHCDWLEIARVQILVGLMRWEGGGRVRGGTRGDFFPSGQTYTQTESDNVCRRFARPKIPTKDKKVLRDCEKEELPQTTFGDKTTLLFHTLCKIVAPLSEAVTSCEEKFFLWTEKIF